MTTLQRMDPLLDPRWKTFLERQQHASVFHSREWLEALHKTYDYRPVVYTTSSPGQALADGVVFCEVQSWMTGRRLVSLPFSDHCEPLVDGADKRETFFTTLIQQSQNDGWRYIEIRPRFSLGEAAASFNFTENYGFHEVDLRPDCDMLFRSFHKGSTQRKIRRAEREGLIYRDGPAHSLLDTFYRLNLMTRRRQGIPPQPHKWFRNLIDCFGDALKIRVALSGGLPIAAIVTFRYKDTLTYKYGGSDARFHNLGGVHFLLWKSIQEAKHNGLLQFDLGRSGTDNSGLITFKNRWGASQFTLTYFRRVTSSKTTGSFIPANGAWKLRLAKNIFSRMPDSCLPVLGDLLYRHVG